MKTMPQAATQQAISFDTDEQRWRAVLDRDPAADGLFYYSVSTTGVYCRPNCPSRRARRSNVRFHETPEAARAAGYRPCRRCRPDKASQASRSEQQAATITKVCRHIEASESIPSEGDELDEAQLATWVKQAAALPGWLSSRTF